MDRVASAFVTIALIVGAIGTASTVGTAQAAAGTVQVDVDVRSIETTETVIADTAGDQATDKGGTQNAITPGERFSGVVGVHEAKVEGKVETRAFGIKVSKARSDRAKAEIIADQVTDIQQRLDELEKRRTSLDQALEAGSITKGRYGAQIAELAVEMDTVNQLAKKGHETSNRLPERTLEKKGVSTSSIETLRDRSVDLKGGEVSQVAQQIAASQHDQPGVTDHNGNDDTGEMDKDQRRDTDQGDGSNAGQNRSDQTDDAGKDDTNDNERKQNDGQNPSEDDSDDGSDDDEADSKDGDDGSKSEKGADQGRGK